MIVEEIREELFKRQDAGYRDFLSGLTPGLDPEKMIGVRTPDIREIAGQILKREDLDLFLQDLPHFYFDENQLHALTVSGIKDYGKCMDEVECFLPYVDNWASCDQMSPKVFRKHKTELLIKAKEWIRSEHSYTVRFGIKMLMQHFLDEDYDPAFADLVSGLRSEEYYINMMIAWYFATALAKQYASVLPVLEQHRLDPRVHNKTIQKAVESYRISPQQKEYLKSLRIKTKR